MENSEENSKNITTVTLDQEVWVKERIKTAIEMAIALNKRRVVGADDPIYVSGVEGIINGAAWEIIRTLNLNTECINLRNPY